MENSGPHQQGFLDSSGNKWYIENGVVLLKLIKETFARRLGIIVDDRFIIYRLRAKHVFHKTNSYGFNYEVIENLSKYHGIGMVDIYDDFGMYRLPINIIKEGDVLFFKEEGFELQRFVSLEVIEQFRLELSEDANRRKLLGDSWFFELKAEFHKPYWNTLGVEVARRRQIGVVYPEKEDVFKAFQLTPYQDVRVIIIGQDPYHNGVADGLAFSSKDPMRIPPSLEKIYEALEDDIRFGLYLDQDPSLVKFATQGILLLNTSLTVDAGQPNSHKTLGWGLFIARVLEVLKYHERDLVFLLWGAHAKAMRQYVENGKHLILEAEHPAYAARESRKWLHNDCFRKTNKFLEDKGYGEIEW